MDLLDPFSCQLHHIAFDRLKSHTPLPCPGTQSINVPLKFHCVFFILNFTIANTVISKKSYFRFSIWWDVIYVQREQQGTKNGALEDTRQNRSPVRFYSIYNNSLLSEAKKRIYPFQCLATDFIAKQFAFKEFMRGCIKCLFKIQYEYVNLSSIVQDFSPIIYYRSQLSFTTISFLNACCLSDRSLYSSRWAMIFEHTMCSSKFARYTSQGNRAIIARKWPVTLLEKGADICKRPFLWDFTSANWLLKKMSKYRT